MMHIVLFGVVLGLVVVFSTLEDFRVFRKNRKVSCILVFILNMNLVLLCDILKVL